MFVNLFDSHTHSRNSNDGEHSVGYLCEAAVEKGLMGICVTDHYECCQPQQRFGVRIRNSVLDTAKARQFVRDGFMLMSGIEIGQATWDLQEAERILTQFRFDYVIGSLHSHKGSDDYCFVDFTDLDVEVILDRYYQELLELCSWGGFDVLGHLTYPLRYITGRDHIPVDMSRYDEIIREILRTLIQQHRGIEVNTSTLRQGLGEPMPSLHYLKMFRELGGEIVTLGSDAHRSADLGAGIPEGMALLQEAGFDYFAFYKKREPRMLRII